MVRVDEAERRRLDGVIQRLHDVVPLLHWSGGVISLTYPRIGAQVRTIADETAETLNEVRLALYADDQATGDGGDRVA